MHPHQESGMHGSSGENSYFCRVGISAGVSERVELLPLCTIILASNVPLSDVLVLANSSSRQT